MVSPGDLTYRLRGCPAAAGEAALRDGLARALGDVTPNDIHIQSLATALDPWKRPPTKTATLRFARAPSVIDSQTKTEWKMEGHGLDGTLLLDTHFLGLTPLNEVKAQKHGFE